MNVQSKNVILTVYFQIAGFPFRGKPCSSRCAVLYDLLSLNLKVLTGMISKQVRIALFGIGGKQLHSHANTQRWFFQFP
jgi:hypothetical protein